MTSIKEAYNDDGPLHRMFILANVLLRVAG